MTMIAGSVLLTLMVGAFIKLGLPGRSWQTQALEMFLFGVAAFGLLLSLLGLLSRRSWALEIRTDLFTIGSLTIKRSHVTTVSYCSDFVFKGIQIELDHRLPLRLPAHIHPPGHLLDAFGRYGYPVQSARVATRPTWRVMVLFMFFLLAAAAAVFEPQLREFAYERVFAHRLEEHYGFRGRRVSLAGSGGKRSFYVLVEITPGGPLDRAGFRAGDSPVGHGDKSSLRFLERLSMLLSLPCQYPDRDVLVEPLELDGLDLYKGRALRVPCAP
jgi:hypothetical protein